MGPCCAAAPGDNEVSRGAVTTNSLAVNNSSKPVLSSRGTGKKGGGSFRSERPVASRTSVRGGRPTLLAAEGDELMLPEQDFTTPRSASRSSPRT